MSGVKRIKRKAMSDHEPQSDTGEEDIILQVRKANMAPKLTCTGCNGFFRGPVTYCQNKHGLCSSCFGNKKECPITGCGQRASLTLDVLSEIVKELKLPISCKFKKDGCDQKNVDEEVIADHEIECGHRKVPCFYGGCPDQPVMDFETHLFSAHTDLFGHCRDNPGKWFFKESKSKTFGAQKQWIDPESGLRFRAVLYHHDAEKLWRCYTVVFGGKNAAKRFRAEMRLSSHDADASLIFNGNVYCLDDWKDFDLSKLFRINDDEFKIHNKGHNELGNHNKDKNGKLTMPVTVEVKMKKLNVG